MGKAPAIEPEIKVIHVRMGTVTVRSDCGCALCRAHFDRPPREDLKADREYRARCANNRYSKVPR